MIDTIIQVAIILGVILVSMTLHEAMHAFVGYWLGDDTAKLQGRLTLNPIKHIDPFMTILLPVTLALIGAPIFGAAKPVPFRPDQVRGGDWGAALVALSGPFTNLLIAFVLFGVWVLSGQATVGIWAAILTTGIAVNLGFFVFNMIPIPPLDGSRLLYAVAPEVVRSAMRYIERLGVTFMFVIVLVAGSLVGNYMSAAVNFLIAVFSQIFRIAG